MTRDPLQRLSGKCAGKGCGRKIGPLALNDGDPFCSQKTGQCACGCGGLAPIATHTDRRKGHVRGQPVRFIVGHGSRGLTRSAETRARMAVAKIGNRHGVGPRAVTPDATSGAVHQWLRKWHPKAGRCDECGAQGKTDHAFLRHPEPHTRDRNDYRELCRRCHMMLDERSPYGRAARYA